MSLYGTEWFCIAAFSFFILLSWFRPMNSSQRWIVFAAGIFSIALVLSGAALEAFFQGPVSTAIRDFLPALLMVLAYWQSGRFYTKPNLQLQERLLEIDGRIAEHLGRFDLRSGFQKWLNGYWELAYLFCYPMVPLGIVIFTWPGRKITQPSSGLMFCRLHLFVTRP